MRHLVSVDDFSIQEIGELFEQAKVYGEKLRSSRESCAGLIAASLFYEPSTRTRLSFEAAMQRLGGGVLTAAEMKNSSASKGESLADTVRIVGAYADLIVLRHPSEGAARLAAEFAAVPVVNAGDGSHEHPTQTLCDLYTLWLEKGSLRGLEVMLAGDLRYGRTAHSFAYALARFGANIICLPHPGLEMPDYVLRRLAQDHGMRPVKADASGLNGLGDGSQAIYLSATEPSEVAPAQGVPVQNVDALYMTRPQTERFVEGDNSGAYMTLDLKVMAAAALKDAIVMHPLPRRDEIAAELDDDPRSLYFEQAARGVPIRMAILAFLLGELRLKSAAPEDSARRRALPAGKNACPNSNCISQTEVRHKRQGFEVTSTAPLRAACAYCSHELSLGLVGCSRRGEFQAFDSPWVENVLLEDLVLFQNRAEAESLGFCEAGAEK